MTTHPPSQIGRYKIERELGRGTMGVVYEARDTTLGRTVALKTFGAMEAIAPHERDAFEQRFLSEARISATLDDQNVVAVYDVGRDFESGLLYMALEYVRGETLGSILSRGAMPWMEAANIIAKVARALQAAHSNHIVHRDIKPANIMLNQEGEPKIMDFGIAKASASQLTLAGQIFGTPAYMSPEQASGEDVDGRSDIFSLGAVLYELVTNTRPFEGPTMAATLTKIIRDDPPPPSKVSDVPRALDPIMTRALKKARDRRYDSAWQFAEDLESLMDGKPPAHAIQASPLETVGLHLPPRPGGERSRRTAPPIRVPIGTGEPLAATPGSQVRLAGAAGLGVVLGIGVVLLLQQRAQPGPTPPPLATATATPALVAVATREPVRPLPAPTRAAIPSPTAVFVPSDMAGAAARVTLDLTHPFGSGSLRVKVDDRVVLANSIGGMPRRVMGVAAGFEGRFGSELVIPPGNHIIRVEVRSGVAEFVESKTVRLQPGERRRLVAFVGKTLTLAFE